MIGVDGDVIFRPTFRSARIHLRHSKAETGALESVEVLY
jgi:hypothetical protein